MQLENMPGFPLHYNPRIGNGNDASDNATQNDVVPGNSSSKSSFQKWLDDLMHYRAKHNGDSNVPLKYAEYPGLGNFVNRQRTEYRKLLQGKSSSMTQTKIQQLDQVDFVWSVRVGGHATWESRLTELRDYLAQHGHTNVPKNYPPNRSLGYWVNEQRFQYRRWTRGKASYMTPSKMAMLNALQFKWSLRESKKPWKDWMEELKKYRAEHGHVNVPLKYDRNVALGSFVNNQRSEYRRYKSGKGTTKMTEEKVRDLEGIGFLWNVRDARTPWDDRWKELREYKKKYGNCDVPNNWPENQPLSYWVAKQRQQYKLYVCRNSDGGTATPSACHLTEDRVKLLDEIGFDWRYHPCKREMSSKATSRSHHYTPWKMRLDELKEYKKKYGNCDVPRNWPENQPLSKWVSKQRIQHKLYLLNGGAGNCHLTEERINLLNEIEFDWGHSDPSPSTTIAKMTNLAVIGTNPATAGDSLTTAAKAVEV